MCEENEIESKLQTISENDILEIMRQDDHPVIFYDRKNDGITGNLKFDRRMKVKLPIEADNSDIVKIRRSHPEKCFANKGIFEGYWAVPRSWASEMAGRLVDIFGHVIIIQGYKWGNSCHHKCATARLPFCQCPCAGVTHGIGRSEGTFFTVLEPKRGMISDMAFCIGEYRKGSRVFPEGSKLEHIIRLKD